MPEQSPPANPPAVVVLDNSPPRRQVSSPSASDEVIVLDQSPGLNNGTNSNNCSEPIVVEENPPKRRRRDNPAALPLHPRATSPSQNSAPVIVVEDDDDSSDPESPSASANPAPFTSVGPVASGRPHVRLPRINTPRNAPVQDDIIEMSARGPNINRTASSVANPLMPPIYPPPTPPTRTRHTSMPPLFSFTERSALGPEVTAPAPPGASPRVPRPVHRQMPRFPTAQQSSTTMPRTTINVHTSGQMAFPQPLPEQALPSTGRRSVRGTRHNSFSDSISDEALSPGARATLTVLRGLEDNGIQGTGPPIGFSRHTGEPFIQVVNGPSVYFDRPQNSAQNNASRGLAGSHFRRQSDPRRQTPFVHTSINLRRRQGPSVRRVSGSGTANPAPPRSGAHRTARFATQGMSRAHLQQLNAMHAASHGMPLQDGGLSLLHQSNADGANSPLASSHRMIVTANLRNASAAPRAVANAADAAAAAVVAAAAAVAGFPSTGLAYSTSQASSPYGQNGFTVSSSGRHRNDSRQTTAQRPAHNFRRVQRLLRITGSDATAGIEIQYLQGIHGDHALDYEQLIRLDEQLIREKNRADKSQIDALPTGIATAEDKEIRCCVCMCDVEEGEELRILPCSHKYHKKCIDEWLTYNGCCPVDKKRIAPRPSRNSFTTS